MTQPTTTRAQHKTERRASGPGACALLAGGRGLGGGVCRLLLQGRIQGLSDELAALTGRLRSIQPRPQLARGTDGTTDEAGFRLGDAATGHGDVLARNWVGIGIGGVV